MHTDIHTYIKKYKKICEAVNYTLHFLHRDGSVE